MREPTVEDVRQLMGASTPHFALQLRNRIASLIAQLPGDHPARVEGEREIARLDDVAQGGERRGKVGRRRARDAQPARGSGRAVLNGLERALALLKPEARDAGVTCAAGGYLDLLGAERARVHRRGPGPDAHRPGAADLRALVAPGPRPRVQGRVRARDEG